MCCLHAERVAGGWACPVGAAHRIGLNETAEAMDIVCPRGAFWLRGAGVSTAAAGSCGETRRKKRQEAADFFVVSPQARPLGGDG